MELESYFDEVQAVPVLMPQAEFEDMMEYMKRVRHQHALHSAEAIRSAMETVLG